MLRRFFVFLFLFSFLVCFLVFPVSAASYHYSIQFVEGEGYLSIVDSIPTSATVSYNISMSITSSPDVSLITSGVGVLTKIEIEPGIYLYRMGFSFDQLAIPLVLEMASFDGLSVVVVDSADGYLDPGYVFDVSLSSVEYPAFEESTSHGLGNVLSWISSILDSLINGGLVPLLSLGSLAIAISILLLAARIIKNNSWGL